MCHMLYIRIHLYLDVYYKRPTFFFLNRNPYTSALYNPTSYVEANRLWLLYLAYKFFFKRLQELEQGVLLISNILFFLKLLYFGFTVLLQDDRHHFRCPDLPNMILLFLIGALFNSLLKSVFLLESLWLLHN